MKRTVNSLEEAPTTKQDSHPIGGLIVDVLNRYFSGDLSKAEALKRFGKILDLYPNGNGDGDDTADVSTAGNIDPMNGPGNLESAAGCRASSFDQAAARRELLGLAAPGSAGRPQQAERALEAAAVAARREWNPL
jgi:hypothetical protein